jgi:alpha-glucosidase/oligosaccharide 4-alpha-D-glucosyltransferase
VFQPIFRPHAQEHIAPEPVFHDTKTKALAKKSIELRYSLIPYNYTIAFDNNQTGVPLMRPLFFENTDNKELSEISFAYLWGDHFLVSPIVKPGIASMDVPFPKGTNWYDFFTGQKFEGGTFKTVQIAEDHIPVFVKAGAFIPMVQPVQTTEMYSTKDLILHYYHDSIVEKSAGKLYDDDGKTPNAFEKGKYEILKFNSIANDKKLSIALTVEKGVKYTFSDRKITLIIHNIRTTPKSVTISGTSPSFDWSEEGKKLKISFKWSSKETKNINISL